MPLTLSYQHAGADFVSREQPSYQLSQEGKDAAFVMESNTIVEIRSAFKRYGSNNPILRGLNMSVRRGEIYGLLGPSGCGKTTLLSCIVGRKFLDAGEIRLALSKKAEIGYMPQDVALFQDFTIAEVFRFYGTLFNLSTDTIDKRSRELLDLLELPPVRRFIKTLSGGQQRRVSFAVALLHDPWLLILDEPTVGVDPVLCHNIWQYLVKIAAVEKKSIIITTHYIEEARNANTIGLMREGVLLTEAPPSELISSQNCSTLEEAFLILSKKQVEETETDERKGLAITYPNVKPNSASSPFPENESFTFSRFLAQLWKNALWTQRNIPILLFILLLPAIQSFLFCCTFGKDPEHLQIGLVSDEFTAVNKACDDLILNVTYSEMLECNVPVSFTCQFFQQLQTKMDVVFYHNLEEAKTAASKNEIWGVMYMNKNFSNAVEERLSEGLHTQDISVDESLISVWLDMSNYIISMLLKKDIQKSLIEFIKDVLETCGLARDIGSIPVRFDDAIYGTNEPVFAHSSAAAFICSFIFYFTMVFTSGAIKMESLSGLLERSMVAGMTRVEVICAHLVVQFIMMTLQTILMMVVLYVLYSNPLHGNLYLTVILLYCIAFVGISFGFLLGEFFEEEKLISYAGVGSTMCLFLVNGCIWPIEGAHYILRSICKLLPMVPAIEGYNSITTRGYGIEENVVVIGFVSCIAWIFIFSVLAHIYAMKKK